MDHRAKWTFWGTAAAAFVIICLPTTYFLDAFRRYERYLSGLAPRPRPTRMRYIPHRDGKGLGPSARLDFVEFKLKQPKAGKVQLIGDFNGWNETGMPLKRSPNGVWELLLPLPSGRHHYLFVVDGQAQLDPGNAQASQVAGRKASVKVIP